MQSEANGSSSQQEQRHTTLKFEILEVYPGTRHKDTVISEIYYTPRILHSELLLIVRSRSVKRCSRVIAGDPVLGHERSHVSFRISIE